MKKLVLLLGIALTLLVCGRINTNLNQNQKGQKMPPVAAPQPTINYANAVAGYHYSPNGSGGVNYFDNNNNPITNKQYASFVPGADTNSIESQAAADYTASQTPSSSGNVLGASTTGSSGGTGTAATPSMIQSITDQNNAITNDAATQAGASANDLENGQYGILNTIANLKLGQSNVDNEHVQNALARTQGLNGVLNMVNHGIQSGGVQLANSNASNSSAAEALARAYGIQGRTAASQVGNQFANAENTTGQHQTAQDTASEEGMRLLNTTKADAINSIVQNASTRLNYLSSLASGSNVQGIVNIEAEKQAIRDQALQALSQYDSQIAGATPTPLAAPDIAAKASDLATAGTAAAAPYNYSTVGPAQLQGTGPQPTELPIFTTPVKKTS